MDNYIIVPYLESKGLNCSQCGRDLIVTAKGTNIPNIQIALSGVPNWIGGYNYEATFKTQINIKMSEKEKVVSEIMEKYGPQKQSGVSFGCDTKFNSCNISIIDNASVLTLTANMMSVDNKKPERDCYDFLLKGFIEKIDESSAIWNQPQKTDQSNKLFVIDMMDHSIFENGTKIYCLSVDDILEYKEKLEFMATLMPIDDVIAAFRDFISYNKTEEYYNIGGKRISIKTVTTPPFKLTISQNKQVVLEIEFILPEDISKYAKEIANTPFNVNDLMNKVKDFMTQPFSNGLTSLKNNWTYKIEK